MRRHVLMLVTVAVVVAACGTPFGRRMPACDERTSTLILQVQSVPDAAYVPCINGLITGWDYQDLIADSRSSTFWLNSDRIGSPFLTVQTVQTCDPGSSAPASSGQPGVELFKDVESSTYVDLVIIPAGQSRVTEARAVEIVAELSDTTIEGRDIEIDVDASPTPTEDRIEAAHRRGAHVIAISIRDAEEGSASLWLQDAIGEQPMDSLDDAIDEIEDATEPPTYAGQWFYVFRSGCAVLTFDASGPGVTTIEDDVQAALGFFDVDPLRQEARDAGFDIP